MSIYTVAEAKNQLSKLIDRALKGEGIVTWVPRSAYREEVTTADIDGATRILRRLDVNLRTPDAIHTAIARRLEATLVTFDRGMAAGARALGVAVSAP
jgi:uncharacterized protein